MEDEETEEDGDSMSFQDWLKKTKASSTKTKQPIIKKSATNKRVKDKKEGKKKKGKEGKGEKETGIGKKSDLIDKFIVEEPKITPKPESKKSSFFNPIDMAKQSLEEDQELSTETLAQVYLDQELFDKAILCYEYLKLKYPEKSSFFANQISSIQKQLKK